MTEEQRKQIEANGFRIRNDGKIMNAEGKLIAQTVAEQVAAGGIIANFDINSLRKARARQAANGNVNLVEALKGIAPQIELLAVGQTARIPMPKSSPNGKDPTRQFVMSIVTKLNNLTAKGREWAGRRFDSMSDETKEFFYVTRLEDGEPKERKQGTGRKGKAATNALQTALANAAEQLDGNDSEAETEAPVAAGEVQEEATLIKH